MKHPNLLSQIRSSRWTSRWTALALCVGASSFSTGCGKQAFEVTASHDEQTAPGTFNVPPKVDLLLVEDDTGSVREAFGQISSQMSGFLTSLSNRGWDYHFATIPLTTFRALSEVQASKYDTNWGASWVAPYPGVDSLQLATVNSTNFRTPENYDAFLRGDETSTALNGSEPGFKTMLQHLRDSSMKNTGFLRTDAILAIVMVGNGNDTSDVNICTRSDGYVTTCDQAGAPYSIPCGQTGAKPSPNCNNTAQTFSNYTSSLKHVKLNGMIKFYAAVAAARYTHGECLGSNSYTGTRYTQMASELGGQSYDLCTQGISTILDGVAQNLQTVKLSFRTQYLFMAQQPAVDSIVVTRHPGGIVSPTDPTISRDITRQNGWDYVGNVSDVYTIDFPAPLNQASGWAVQLFGSGKLTGADTATVTSMPFGAQDSVAK